MLIQRAHALADIICHTAQAKKVFDSLFHSQLEAPDIPLPEGHLCRFLYGGQIRNVNLVLQKQWHQARGIGQRGQGVEHVVSGGHIEIVSSLTGGKDKAGHHIALISIQHPLRVGSRLHGMNAALPGSLEPKNRLVR